VVRAPGLGPLDGTEWQVVERFFSDRRAGELPCLPYLLQTPRGTDCIVTMCMDCDEAVASCRDLFELYIQENIPFSVAVKGRNSSFNTAWKEKRGTCLEVYSVMSFFAMLRNSNAYYSISLLPNILTYPSRYA
jgi:hypothetical protein